MRISDWSSDVCSSDLSAAPLTSVSIATGQVRTLCTDPNMSAPDQPGLGVVRIWPKRGLPGSRSTGPKLAIPTAFTGRSARSEEHTSELQSLMRISYAVFCLKKKILTHTKIQTSGNIDVTDIYDQTD